MSALVLHDFHHGLGAHFSAINAMEVAADYGDLVAEHAALCDTAGLIDLSCRSRICLLGSDRQKFLNGQVTNNVKDLKNGQGCYAALVTAKGKLQSDLNVFILADEILLDFEPGLASAITGRLEQFVIADDVQVIDVAPHYGLLSVQGPLSGKVVEQLNLGVALPVNAMTVVACKDETLGELYFAKNPRLGSDGFDLFVPNLSLAAVADKLIQAVKGVGGRASGWDAFEIARVEAGIPRFGADMDETNLAPEGGIESRAISYAKGCYIGQEVIARIRTYGQVAKSLRRLRLADGLASLPLRGDKLFKEDKEAGYVTSAVKSLKTGTNVALGYVRKEYREAGNELILKTASGESRVLVEDLPLG